MVTVILWAVLGTALVSGVLSTWHLLQNARAREVMRAELSWVRYQDDRLRGIENEIKEIDQVRQALSLRVEQGKPPPVCGMPYEGRRSDVKCECTEPAGHVGVHMVYSIRWYNDLRFPNDEEFIDYLRKEQTA